MAYSLSAVLEVPLSALVLVGVLLTYAERRGQKRRTTASTLAAELG